MNRNVNLFLVIALGSLAVGCSGSSDDGAASRVPDTEAAPTPVVVLDGSLRGSPVSPEELAGRLNGERDFLLIDVRSPEEFSAGHIPGAVNIPYDQLPSRLDELNGSQDQEVIVYCRTGRRAGIAEQALQESGFQNVRDLDGHMVDWNSAGYPVSDPVPCC